MRIQHNITAMNSYRNFSNNTSKLNKNLEKLASGYKINRAGDDAAGLAISEKMRAQISGLEGATKNAKDGISLIQTAEGALTEVHDMLNRMVTLAEQSANGTYQDELDREQLQKEVQNLKDEIDRVADSTNYNGIQLLNGDLDYAKETTVTADSAISNITKNDFVSSGTSEAFKINQDTIVTRPEAAVSQTNAQFRISLNAVKFNGLEKGDTLTLSVNGSSFAFTIGGSTATTGAKRELITGAFTAATALASAIASKIGYAVPTNSATASNATTYNPAVDGSATSTTNGTSAWAAAYSTANDPTKDAHIGNVVQIDGHYYTVTSEGEDLVFNQVDRMETGSAPVNPAYSVSFSITEEKRTDANGHTDDNYSVVQQPNAKTQVTVAGKSIGSSQQAQADIDIDFTKLRDGDKLTAGEFTYTFKIGSESTLSGTNTKADMDKGKVVIDLSDIFKEDADLNDATKQNLAMTRIVNQMGDGLQEDYAAASIAAGVDAGDVTTLNKAWTVGDGSVNGGIGTLHFQSKDSYDGDTTTTAANMRYVGQGITTDPKGDTLVDMRTEKGITDQFVFERAKTAASTSFDLDVGKIKAGDTFTIDGKTFEFTDGPDATGSGNVAINLKDEGIAGGILNSKRANVADKIKTALDNNLKVTQDGNKVAKYEFSRTGDTITLTSKEDTTTANIHEERISAEISTPSETTYGKGLVLQIGDTSDEYNMMSVSVADMHSDALGIGDVDISTQDGASVALDSIKAAVNKVSDTRGNLGAMQNRLEHTINNLGVMRENVQNAESLIRDTDVAEEMMAYTKNNILNQSAQAMLAQANQLPQGVLQLLG